MRLWRPLNPQGEQTFIALRARRQGYRIARDILHPRIKPAIPLEPEREEELDYEPAPQCRRRLSPAEVALIFACIIAFICAMAWLSYFSRL